MPDPGCRTKICGRYLKAQVQAQELSFLVGIDFLSVNGWVENGW